MEDKKKSKLYLAIRGAVKFFSPKYTADGTENLPEDGYVIIGNHSQMYGPIASELYAPGKHKTWCVSDMMEKEKVADYTFRDFWSEKPKAVRWIYKLFSKMIPSLSVLIFTNAETIPVYRDLRLVSTMRQTVECLKNGWNVVIFPESEEPLNNIICKFHDRFIDLGKYYYRATGKKLKFVPMYLAPRNKTMSFGKPAEFDPDAPAAEERKRICDYLMEEITRMAVSKPEHTVIPFKETRRRNYPKNLPLTVYDENYDEKEAV
ncbi:MAG: hypothetical protein IIZ48_06550 [Erysipelotrichales bacterium]|nr:hypothetical protein [Erysipelotrichales bacterium]